jgi:GMP synthase (glutamine-hydrolysing)
MTTTSLSKPVLLLQIRDNPRVRKEEHESFARYSGLNRNSIDILNVFDTPAFTPAIVDRYAAVFVGGASEASVLEPEKYSFLESAIKLLQYCIDRDIPVFASCFGFQLAVIALDGRIIRDQQDFEMGTLPISITASAEIDPVFAGIPNGFRAVSVHKERATELPANCELLAYTDACPHAFRITNKPFWAFQFHPELDRKTLLERLQIFSAGYTSDDTHLQQIIATVQETPEANQLPRNFVQRVLLSQADP